LRFIRVGTIAAPGGGVKAIDDSERRGAFAVERCVDRPALQAVAAL